MRALLQVFACFILATPLYSAAAEEFGFWPNEGAREAPGFKSMSEGPCGEVAYAEVAKLPLPKGGALASELIVELNRRGKVIRRWPGPVDYTPSALKGDELLVTAGERGFWIRPDGTFRKASPLPSSERGEDFACDLKQVFGNSAYAGCAIFKDVVTRKKRRLGYQGVCT